MCLGTGALRGALRCPHEGHALPVLDGSGQLAPEQLGVAVPRVGVVVDGGDEDGTFLPALLHPDEGLQLLPMVP